MAPRPTLVYDRLEVTILFQLDRFFSVSGTGERYQQSDEENLDWFVDKTEKSVLSSLGHDHVLDDEGVPDKPFFDIRNQIVEVP